MFSSTNPFTRFARLASQATALLVAMLVVVSCEKEKKKDETPAPQIAPDKGVFIGNEGLFGHANSSLMFYTFGEPNASPDLFAMVNNAPLGDVFQSMLIDSPRIYTVINNSQKIEVLELPTLRKLGTVTGFESPRYMTKISDDVAFVTNYGSTITRVSLPLMIVAGSVQMPDWTERIEYLDGKLYVTTVNANQLYVVDPNAMQIVDSLTIQSGGDGLVTDKDGMMWVYCKGGWSDTATAHLYKINPSTLQVVSGFNIGSSLSYNPSRLCMNATRDTLYYQNGDVYRMSIYDSDLQPAFIPANGMNIYGIFRHPAKPYLFITDAKDFLQKGNVLQHSPDGALLNTIQAGIAPAIISAY